MARIAYINGEFVPDHEAMVPFHDRGYHFADGMYEVVAYYNQRLLDWQPHLKRMHRSLDELSIPAPLHDVSLIRIIHELIRRNRQRNGLVYLQVTRGVQRRNHMAGGALKPTLSLCILPENKKGRAQSHSGVAVATGPDERWARCNIKSTSLLPNTLAKATATEKSVYELWQLRDGMITEGSASNSYIIDSNDTLITHPANAGILGGIVRERIIELAHQHNITVEERSFSLEEAYRAKEAFLSSSSAHILPVTNIDNAGIAIGKITRTLQAAYDSHVFAETEFNLKSTPND